MILVSCTMPKRRRTQILSEDSKDSSDSSKKRRTFVDINALCQELYDTIRNHKTEDGRILCETFVRAPNRRSLAEYYDVIASPMDLLKIQQKIKTEEYGDLEQFSADIELLVNNAKSYYKKHMQEYKDACELWEVFLEAKTEIFSGDGKKDEDKSSDIGEERSGSECGEEESPYEELFTAIMTAADMDGRSLSTMFQLLPSKSLYPEYYKVIQDPIDLKMIAQRIQNNEYNLLSEMEKDLFQMIKNAKIFNEPGSQIYKDAATLKKIIVIKKSEIDQRKSYPSKTSERIRAKKSLPGQKWSSLIATLEYDSDGEIPIVQPPVVMSPSPAETNADDANDAEEGNESDPEDAESNPMWQLYETVKNYVNPQGYQLSEPFWRLPSRRNPGCILKMEKAEENVNWVLRSYPDYYKEIKQPMSLFKIRVKIKSRQYTSLVDVVDDMNLMFENAKKYNRPDSKLFKDAVKLQKIMQAKARELINLHMKDSESDDDDDRSMKRKAKKFMIGNSTPEAKKSKKSIDGELSLKKKCKLLYKAVHDYVDSAGRPLITMFMDKPSKKDYPDYYEVIANPIDMKTIDSNIKSEKYTSEEQLISDFRLMFANCRQYNEEGSQIYQDAETLEQALNNKIEELCGPLCETPKLKIPLKKMVKENSKEEVQRPSSLFSVKQKLRNFYDTVKEYTDGKGRRLSLIFNKLPSKTDYPDYYEVIKKPIDLDKIGNKVKSGQYENLEDMLSDFVLMFDNACKYNEPDSQIYKVARHVMSRLPFTATVTLAPTQTHRSRGHLKDALTLQRIALQTKVELSEDSNNGIPDVRSLIQELLTNLFISTYNHQDEEGRCFSDSLIEFYETDSPSDPEKKPVNLDMIKRNLDRGRYKRLDRFQDDMFEVFEYVRNRSRTDSQVFEDSVELQSFFIKVRDELCKNGEILQSPALQYTEADLQASVETLKAQKLPKEQQEAELEPKQEKEERSKDEMSSSDSATFQTQTYYVGDFVYVEPREKGMDPHIIHIEKLWRDNQGEQWLYGCWFYRPNETFHLATRKFLEKEVFKSDNYNSTPLNQVIGKCYVMFVKDYFKNRPEEFEFKDVYVCESRYSAKAKAFKKIKIWSYTPNSHVHIVPREEAVDPVRVPSMFKDGFEKPKEEDSEEADLGVLDKPRPNVSCEDPNPEEGATYYEQYTIPSGTYRLGDCCYVRTENNKKLIGRIDRMWIDQTGRAFFHGPWFVTPQEIQHPPTRLFFKQEVFLSSIEDTNPLLSIIGHCVVLDYKDYVTKRPTEIPEQDVYICESRYMEAERQIRRLPKGLKKFTLSPVVTEDEFYFFRKVINPQKIEVISTTVSNVKKSPLPYPSMDIDSEADGSVGSSPHPWLPKDRTPGGKQKFVDAWLKMDLFKDWLAKVPGEEFYARCTVCNQTLKCGKSDLMKHGEGKKHGENMQKFLREKKNKIASTSSIDSPVKKEEMSPLTPRPSTETDNEESNDMTAALSVKDESNSSLPTSSSKKKTSKQRLVTGYILFASEIRRSIVSSHPDSTFGDISRIIGTEWRNLPASQKTEYEERALKQNEETAARESISESTPQSPASVQGSERSENTLYECLWENCDFQFEDMQDLIEHLVVEPNGHVQISYHGKDSDFQCLWQNCSRIKKNVPPFPNLQRLIRHCKEVHLKTSVKNVPPESRGRNFVPSKKSGGITPVTVASVPSKNTPAYVPPPPNPQGHYQPQFSPAPQTYSRLTSPYPYLAHHSRSANEPMFVSPPPRSERLLHSSVYIKYIESLQAESRSISNWDAQLKATPENTVIPDTQHLPVQWLGNGAGNHGNVVNALWALRNYMLRDSLNISGIL